MPISVTTMALACLIFLGLGAAALLAMTRVARLADVAKSALPILVTEVIIVGSAVGTFWTGGWVLTLAILLLAGRITWEVLTIQRARIDLPLWPVTIAVPVVCLIASLIYVDLLIPLALAGAVAAAAISYFAPVTRHRNLADLVLFPAIPLVLFCAGAIQGGHGAWLLLAFLLVETFDSYALLGGKFLGKTKALPRLSPKKTIEGLICGTVVLALTAVLAALVLGLPVGAALGIAVLTAPLAIAGDLAASRLKRLAGVKDYPPVLPHQGGIFDITDAWITTGAGFLILSAFV